jgi:hypothetical protein
VLRLRLEGGFPSLERVPQGETVSAPLLQTFGVSFSLEAFWNAPYCGLAPTSRLLVKAASSDAQLLYLRS